MTKKYTPRGLRLLRLFRGWTQAQLSEVSGIDKVRICRLERGARIRLEEAEKLASCLDAPVEFLLAEHSR